MNYVDIVEAVTAKKKVHWSNASYWIVRDDNGDLFISYLNQNYVVFNYQLFHENYDPKDFYLSPF